MRVAVLSDIHGYDLAFERVLADIDATGPYDEIVVAGDLCEVGPNPKRVLDIIRQRGLKAVKGNTDDDIAHLDYHGEGEDSVSYAQKQIGIAGIDFLRGLPELIRISPPGGNAPDYDLLIVHANPHDLTTALEPAYGDDQLREIFRPVRAGAIAFGHVHICYVREIDGILLVDVSAVGNPKDGDLRSKYGVLTWDETRRIWSAEIRKLEYPLEETKDEMRESGMPGWEKAFKKLKRATYGKRAVEVQRRAEENAKR
ncbi:metallophosphoesterase family protein [soil metagenome]